MYAKLRSLFRVLFLIRNKILTFFWCFRSGLKFNKTWSIGGKIVISKPNLFHEQPKITIGNYFSAQSIHKNNAFGIIQPILFYTGPGSEIIIGDKVGMSGCTISSFSSIHIGNNVLIGTGVIISDHDAHPLNLEINRERPDLIKRKQVIIEDNVFIGARSIILKGVTIGKGSVIGAGSVVAKSIAPNSIAAGNPCVVIKSNK